MRRNTIKYSPDDMYENNVMINRRKKPLLNNISNEESLESDN
jgi:hypothetical protein